MATNQNQGKSNESAAAGVPPGGERSAVTAEVAAAIERYRSNLLVAAGREAWLAPLKALVLAMEPQKVSAARQTLTWCSRVVVDVTADRVVPVDLVKLFSDQNLSWWEHRALQSMERGSVSTARSILRKVQRHVRGEPTQRVAMPRPAVEQAPLRPELLDDVVRSATALSDQAVVALIVGVGAGMAAVGVEGAVIACDEAGRVWVTHRKGWRRPVVAGLSSVAAGFDGAVARKAGWAQARAAAASVGSSVSLRAAQVTHASMALHDDAPMATLIVEHGLSRRSIEGAAASMTSPDPAICAALLRGVAPPAPAGG